MAGDATRDRVWDVIESAGIGMLTTQFSEGLRARPLEARPDRAAGVIWFVTDAQSAKEHDIAGAPEAGLLFIDHKAKAYLSLTGKAESTRDPAQARKIWKKTDEVWWPGGPEDPNVVVLRFTPTLAELWDGPSNPKVVAFEFAKALAIGTEPDLGQNRKRTVRLSSS